MRKYKSLMATIMEDIYPIHEKYQYFSESVEHIGEMVGKDVKVKLRRKGHEYTEKGKVTKVDGDYLIVKHDFSNRPSKVHKRDVIEETQLDDSLVDAVRAVLSGQPTETQEDIQRRADLKMVKVKLPDGHIVMRRERPTIEIGKGKNESLDPVDQKALKGKHKDRKDKDIDNDGDVDSSDEYLHKRRKAVAKAVAKEEVELDEVGGAAFGGTIDKIQKVVDDKTAMKIDGVMVDTFTASLIMNIFKKVNKQNQDKMRKMKVTQLANAAYKLSGMKEEVELDEATYSYKAATFNGNVVKGTGSTKGAARKDAENKAKALGSTIRKRLPEEAEDNPANRQHLCAKNVVHEQWGEGMCIPTMHADPDAEGNVGWYDIMFEHGIETRVSIEELKVTKAESHMHSSKKKIKENDDYDDDDDDEDNDNDKKKKKMNGKKDEIDLEPKIDDQKMTSEMSDVQMKKREEIVKSMKKKMSDFKKRYGDRAKDVMYATATKMAMKT